MGISIAEVHTAQVWYSFNSKRQLITADAPTPFTFYLKPHSYENGACDRWLCADNQYLRTAWISSLRLKMSGGRFYNDFVSAQEKASNGLTRSSSDRTIYDFENNDNFAAMDFTGLQGRVIHDLTELATYKEQERFSWKRRFYCNRMTSATSVPRNLSYGSPRSTTGWIARAMHHTQPWYFGKLSREEAYEQVSKLGNIDGTFLMRDSQTIVGGIVLTLVFHGKARHYPVSLVERFGEYFYTVDQGHTRFESLIHFIDHHRLNKGSLPCLLIHECSRPRASSVRN